MRYNVWVHWADLQETDSDATLTKEQADIITGLLAKYQQRGLVRDFGVSQYTTDPDALAVLAHLRMRANAVADLSRAEV